MKYEQIKLRANKSTWTVDMDAHKFYVQNAELLWTNWEGRENNFGSTQKNINIVLPDDDKLIADLTSFGVRIKTIDILETNMKLNFVNVKVNMTSQYPPRVHLCTIFRGKPNTPKLLNDETVETLDHIETDKVDVEVNIYKSSEKSKFPNRVVLYLLGANVYQKPNLLDESLRDWETADAVDASNAADDADDAVAVNTSKDDLPF